MIILIGNQGKANANDNEMEFDLHQIGDNISYIEIHALWKVICQKLLCSYSWFQLRNKKPLGWNWSNKFRIIPVYHKAVSWV